MSQPANEQLPLDWVDDFISHSRSFLYLREEDDLLILIPNQSYKINKSAQKILKPLLNGRTLKELIGNREPPPNVRRDLFNFFTGLVAMVKGCLGEGRGRPEVETIPYEKPYNKLPVLSEVALTYRCNLSCRFCYAGHTRLNDSADPKTINDRICEELNCSQFETIFRIIRNDARVPSVSFTGGEPTTRRDLIELVATAVKTGLRVNLISNGTLVDSDMARELKNAGLSSAQISLEGPENKIHDYLTGVSGSFESTLRGIENLKKAGITVHTNTTLNAHNLDSSLNIPDLVKELAINRFSMNMIIPSKWLKDNNPELLLKYSETGDHVLKIRNKARSLGLTFMWYSPTPYCLFNPIAHNLGNKGCAACDGLLSIDPKGRIIPCSSFFEPQGSLLEESFHDIWNKKSACAIREKRRAPSTCAGCDSFNLCEGACPLYWNVMGKSELNASCAEIPTEPKGR